jgi:hypothetical protein
MRSNDRPSQGAANPAHASGATLISIWMVANMGAIIAGAKD